MSEEAVPGWNQGHYSPTIRVLGTARADPSTREITGLSVCVSREAVQDIFPCSNRLFWQHLLLLLFFVYIYTREETLKRKANSCLFSSLLGLI